MKWLDHDDKYHRVFAWFPVTYQADYGVYKKAWLQFVYRQYNGNRAAIGLSPWVYATEESLARFRVPSEKIPHYTRIYERIKASAAKP